MADPDRPGISVGRKSSNGSPDPDAFFSIAMLVTTIVILSGVGVRSIHQNRVENDRLANRANNLEPLQGEYDALVRSLLNTVNMCLHPNDYSLMEDDLRVIYQSVDNEAFGKLLEMTGLDYQQLLELVQLQIESNEHQMQPPGLLMPAPGNNVCIAPTNVPLSGTDIIPLDETDVNDAKVKALINSRTDSSINAMIEAMATMAEYLENDNITTPDTFLTLLELARIKMLRPKIEALVTKLNESPIQFSVYNEANQEALQQLAENTSSNTQYTPTLLTDEHLSFNGAAKWVDFYRGMLVISDGIGSNPDAATPLADIKAALDKYPPEYRSYALYIAETFNGKPLDTVFPSQEPVVVGSTSARQQTSLVEFISNLEVMNASDLTASP